VRELASRLAINPNTIQKSYQELERQKVIETLRGKGTFVCLDYQVREDEERMDLFQNSLRKILVEAHYLGLNQERILALVSKQLEELGIGEGTR
jgi:GntR family transcriptional regulator